jgi:hypothetical protein
MADFTHLPGDLERNAMVTLPKDMADFTHLPWLCGNIATSTNEQGGDSRPIALKNAPKLAKQEKRRPESKLTAWERSWGRILKRNLDFLAPRVLKYLSAALI